MNWNSSSKSYALTEVKGVHVLVISETGWPAFQKLVQDALNTRPDSPPEIKELGDMVTVGQVWQDYATQAGVKNV